MSFSSVVPMCELTQGRRREIVIKEKHKTLENIDFDNIEQLYSYMYACKPKTTTTDNLPTVATSPELIRSNISQACVTSFDQPGDGAVDLVDLAKGMSLQGQAGTAGVYRDQAEIVWAPSSTEFGSTDSTIWNSHSDGVREMNIEEDNTMMTPMMTNYTSYLEYLPASEPLIVSHGYMPSTECPNVDGYINQIYGNEGIALDPYATASNGQWTRWEPASTYGFDRETGISAPYC